MKKTTGLILVILVILSMSAGVALAAQAEWRDSAYHFDAPKFILVMDPTFRYEGYETDGRNKFNRYPYAKEKITDMLNEKLQGLPQHRYVDMAYLVNQIKADSKLTESVDPQSPTFPALVQREMGKHVDLVLYLDVRDLGWSYEWHEAYTTRESYTERIRYKRKHADGTESEGWTEIPRTRTVYHEEGYFVYDTAGLSLRLFDAKGGRDVWKFSDARSRKSPMISDGYDPSGPESMMKRIFKDAFKKTPLAF